MSCSGVCSCMHDNNYFLANSPAWLPNSARDWGEEDDGGEDGEHGTSGRMALNSWSAGAGSKAWAPHQPQLQLRPLPQCSSAAGWMGWGKLIPQEKRDGLLLHQKELSAPVSPPCINYTQLPGTKHHAEGEALINCAINTGTVHVRASHNKPYFWSQLTLTHWARDSL